MRNLVTTVCLGWLLAAGAACLDFGDDATPIETVEIEGPLATEIGDRVDPPGVDRVLLPAPVETEIDPCQCDNQGCIDQWVSKNLGCDVCVVLRCGDQRSHVCSHCDPTPGPEPE